MQDCRNPNANALELLQSGAKPLIWSMKTKTKSVTEKENLKKKNEFSCSQCSASLWMSPSKFLCLLRVVKVENSQVFLEIVHSVCASNPRTCQLHCPHSGCIILLIHNFIRAIVFQNWVWRQVTSNYTSKIVWDVTTYPCTSELLLAHKSHLVFHWYVLVDITQQLH